MRRKKNDKKIQAFQQLRVWEEFNRKTSLDVPAIIINDLLIATDHYVIKDKINQSNSMTSFWG